MGGGAFCELWELEERMGGVKRAVTPTLTWGLEFNPHQGDSGHHLTHEEAWAARRPGQTVNSELEVTRF